MSKIVCTLDTETTGTDPEKDQIIEIAIVAYQMKESEMALCRASDDGAVIGDEVWTFHRRILPTIAEIKVDAFGAHGISLEMLIAEGCQPFHESAGDICAAISEAEVIVGYNVDFDLQFLESEIARLGMGWPIAPGTPIVDPFRLWRQVEERNLGTAHRRFVGEELEGAHGALADVRGTTRVLTGMMQHFNLPEMSWNELAVKCDPERHLRFGWTHHLQWKMYGETSRLTVCFGKADGTPLWDVPRDYLRWMLRQDFPRHVRAACEQVLAIDEKQRQFHQGAQKSFPAGPTGEAALNDWARNR